MHVLPETSDKGVPQFSQLSNAYLKGGEGYPHQQPVHWCHAIHFWIFNLDIIDNLDNAIRITALVMPHANDLMWQREEFMDIHGQWKKSCPGKGQELWHAFANGKYGAPTRQKPSHKCGSHCQTRLVRSEILIRKTIIFPRSYSL